MSNWHNESGRPLAGETWLEAHHRAKLPERKAFVKRIAERAPRRIVDLGCGPGLWLELCSEVLHSDCEFIGIDSDQASLVKAREKSERWEHSTIFEQLNLETNSADLPDADIFLAFNIFPYVTDLTNLLENIRLKLRPGGCLIVRQYDGSLLRLGPMNSTDRQLIDMSLMASVMGSGQFKHYDLDRVFESLTASDYVHRSIDFDVFKRVAPYPSDFRDYFLNTIEWTYKYISEEAGERLKKWMKLRSEGESQHIPSYFMEVDLVAWLS